MAQWWSAFIPSIKRNDGDDHQDDGDDNNDDGNGDDDDDNDGSGAGHSPSQMTLGPALIKPGSYTHTLPAHLQEAQWITGRSGQFG